MICCSGLTLRPIVCLFAACLFASQPTNQPTNHSLVPPRHSCPNFAGPRQPKVPQWPQQKVPTDTKRPSKKHSQGARSESRSLVAGRTVERQRRRRRRTEEKKNIRTSLCGSVNFGRSPRARFSLSVSLSSPLAWGGSVGGRLSSAGPQSVHHRKRVRVCLLHSTAASQSVSQPTKSLLTSKQAMTR